jgi:hypothetical protein
LTANGIGWDESLPETESAQIEQWLQSLQKLANLKRTRAAIPKEFGKIIRREMHAFSDGSETGLGLIVYVKSVNEDGEAHVCFQLAKALVTPKKIKTIPRIELQALLLSMRAVKFIVNESDVTNDKIYQWTDSTAVLMMLQNTTRSFLPFVANHLQEIRDLQGELAIEVRHVPGELNTADVCSRGLSVDKFMTYDAFYNGPDPTIEKIPDNHPELKRDVTVLATDQVDETAGHDDRLMRLV